MDGYYTAPYRNEDGKGGKAMIQIIVAFLVGVVATAIVAFFVAKNNVKTMLKLFAEVDGLPEKAKQILRDKGINI